MKALNIRFSDKEHENLQQTSKNLERSINDIVREAVRQYLQKLEASNL
ncbi:ribbon-helix-helix protein, CopG family [Aetokthonos hydrillicola Thurmond2011]|jgi:predicted DNA-binding protein|uniref:Ribbon-helix-helix protein, CopG family n=1 Tax=Aetokthonos hydrillicola Thurmond2011 TaxID=2712845 RepID=A0AAP5M5D6_9CYAN|nr:ribbon-helix-helix protein, CopG family [Aetokthonos hydrillicola CCALA 1050]MBW4586851.1 ribbon-helix-helix protein, CopG family [Aetokthonos hydrillicola CCALA 1050]MDR9895791.1 ribbon-helix-helix protein, CopG family [Aetokthonos hydrillicola Thurmond2011]